MADRILTSHAGSLPRPEHLIELNARRASGGRGGAATRPATAQELRAAVAAVVTRQREAGIDIVNDGEFGHGMGQRYDYGPWWTYVFQRLGGLELVGRSASARPSRRGRRRAQSRSRASPSGGTGTNSPTPTATPERACALPTPLRLAPVCRGPITYTGQEALQQRHCQLQGGTGLAGA